MSFVTIKQAAEISGKSEVTIRRLVKSIVADVKSKRREQVSPSPQKMKEFKKSKKPYNWEISEDLIKEHFGILQKASANMSGDVLGVLQNQLKTKDQQIQALQDQLSVKDKHIDSLSERLHEGNVLMASLQKHLALPGAQSDTVVEVPSTKKTQSKAKKSQASAENATPKASAPVKKEGFWKKIMKEFQ